MSDSEVIKIYHEGIQSIVTLVPGLSTQISDLSQTVEKQNKTSKNNSLPYSTDGFKKTKSLREPSNKKLGGQVRHKGLTLKIVKHLDDIVKHDPQTCQECECSLEDIDSEKVIRRQVFDLPTLKL